MFRKKVPVTIIILSFVGQRHSSSPKLSLLPLLSSTLPGPSAVEVTTLRHYTNMMMIIIIITAQEVFGLDLNTVTESLLMTVFGSEFQTAGAGHQFTCSQLFGCILQ